MHVKKRGESNATTKSLDHIFMVKQLKGIGNKFDVNRC